MLDSLYFVELSFRETAFKPTMKHVGKVLMYMDSARDSKLLSFENDESLQICGFLGTRETCLKKSSAAKWQFLELTIIKSACIHATGVTTTEFSRLFIEVFLKRRT